MEGKTAAQRLAFPPVFHKYTLSRANRNLCEERVVWTSIQIISNKEHFHSLQISYILSSLFHRNGGYRQVLHAISYYGLLFQAPFTIFLMSRQRSRCRISSLFFDCGFFAGVAKTTTLLAFFFGGTNYAVGNVLYCFNWPRSNDSFNKVENCWIFLVVRSCRLNSSWPRCTALHSLSFRS